MLAVMARLHLKQGRESECEALQQRVLAMRRAALGLHHEDTHRSAMDVYSRRRQACMRVQGDQERYTEMGDAMEVCFEMLHVASVEKGGAHCFALSKSLQGMWELVFPDLLVLARRAVWPKEKTLSLLRLAIEICERLPSTTHTEWDSDGTTVAAAAAAAAGEPFFPFLQDQGQAGDQPDILGELEAAQVWRDAPLPTPRPCWHTPLTPAPRPSAQIAVQNAGAALSAAMANANAALAAAEAGGAAPLAPLDAANAIAANDEVAEAHAAMLAAAAAAAQAAAASDAAAHRQNRHSLLVRSLTPLLLLFRAWGHSTGALFARVHPHHSTLSFGS